MCYSGALPGEDTGGNHSFRSVVLLPASAPTLGGPGVVVVVDVVAGAVVVEDMDVVVVVVVDVVLEVVEVVEVVVVAVVVA